MKETKIYVGLNDSVSLTQMFDSEKYVSILKHVCANYHVPFSFSIVQGGYYHESGELTQENTLLITLIDVDDKVFVFNISNTNGVIKISKIVIMAK